jgi:hypothetical protein
VGGGFWTNAQQRVCRFRRSEREQTDTPSAPDSQTAGDGASDGVHVRAYHGKKRNADKDHCKKD